MPQVPRGLTATSSYVTRTRHVAGLQMTTRVLQSTEQKAVRTHAPSQGLNAFQA